MNLESYDDQDGMKVWLSSDELSQLMQLVESDTQKRIAFGLGGYCGLRTEEIVNVCPGDVVDSDKGYIVRVWESAKTGEYRETPIPASLAKSIWTAGDLGGVGDDEPIFDISKRTLRRWMENATEELRESTGEDGWRFVGFHDLRRTWATQLRGSDVDAMVVCDWGGWNDLETFLEHYRGVSTPEAQRREREKVDWL